jgi:hypothetical protein
MNGGPACKLPALRRYGPRAASQPGPPRLVMLCGLGLGRSSGRPWMTGPD